MKVVMIISGTGGTQVLSKLKTQLEIRGHEVKTITTVQSLKSIITDAEFLNANMEILRNIRILNPDCIFTETSSVCSAHLVFSVLNELKGKYFTVSVQDVWDSTGERYKEYMPDLICLPNESSYELLSSIGIKNLFLYTNPTFIGLGKQDISTECDRKHPRIIYYSQGITRRNTMNRFLKKVERVFDKPNITIKLHPYEFGYINKKYRVVRAIPADEHFDLVLGCDSTVQLKTLVSNIPTIFYDKNVYHNLKEFVTGTDNFITNPIYDDFKTCTSEDIFIDRTDELISLIERQL